MLEVTEASVRYGAIEAVRGVTLRVRKGEIVSLLGANGAGKTSLVSAIVGILPCAGGQIAFEGRDITSLPAETVVGRGPMPKPGYLAMVKALCEQAGALYIADEVQTGLGRTGTLWAIDKHGVVPDVLVTSKGLGGGLYPIGALILSARAGHWLVEDGFAHMSTFGGSELGCHVALKVLEITARPETRALVAANIARFEAGLAAVRARHANWLTGIRQDGLVIGLEFAAPEGAKAVMRALYERGVWAIFSTLDPSVLQVKPGLLLEPAVVDTLLERLEMNSAVTQ